MPEYITFPIEVDVEDIVAEVTDYLKTKWPDWEPADGNLDNWIINAIAVEAAQLREIASQVPPAIFRWFGANLADIPPLDGSPSTTNTTWTMRDNAGYTIEAGTQVGIRAAGDELIPFEVVSDVIVPPGSTVTATGAVQVVSVDIGVETAGLGSVGGSVELIDPLDYVTTILMTAGTTGGTDDESDDDYLIRLAAELTLLAPRPILPNDFAILARRTPGVARALAIDGYNPAGGGTYNNLRTVALAIIDASGQPVSSAIKTAVQADLQAKREVNFIINVIDPTYSTINVTFTVKVLPGYDPADVETRAEAAVADYLSPATWGLLGTPNDWFNVPSVRYLEVAQVINEVIGVDYITTTSGNYDLTIAINPAAGARLDLALPGAAPLPQPGTIAGTAVA